jgi:hypothetical protein
MSLPSENGADESAGILADLSLGSLGSVSFSSSPRQKLASLSTALSSSALATPSPSQPVSGLYSRTKTDVTATPNALKRTAYPGDDPEGEDIDARDEPATPVAPRSKRGQSGVGVNLTLREQEKVWEILLQVLCS